MSERPKVQHSKCCVVQATPGSNPGATATNSRHAMRGGIFCFQLGCKTGGGGPRSPACTIFKTTNVVVFYIHIVLWKDLHMFNPSAQSTFEITVDEQLAELDLTVSVIHDAMRSGFSRSRGRTALAPNSASGMDVYTDGVEKLAMRLVVEGRWEKLDVRNQVRLVHSEKQLVLILRSASGVGDLSQQPIVPPVGPVTCELFSGDEAGQKQLTLLGKSGELLESGEEGTATRNEEKVYFLLHERSENTLKLEVTQASGVDNNGHIIWGERIILPPLVLNEEPIEANEDEEDSTFDVSVERRP